jgi:predicted MFS family arabinose efflux permease
LLYAAGGLGAVAVADAVSFLAAAALVGLVRTRPPAPVEGETVEGPGRILSEWVDGIRLVRRDRSIGMLFVVFALMTFGGTMLDPLAAPWVRDVLHGGPGVYALLMVVHSVAGIGGSLLVGSYGGRLSSRTLCGVGSLLAGCLLLVRFNVPVLGVAVVLSLVSGITSVASSVGVDTLAQQRIPGAYRGRVFGSLQATIWLASLLGAALGGVGAERIGVVGMLDVASALVGLAGVVVLIALPARPPDRVQQAGR